MLSAQRGHGQRASLAQRGAPPLLYRWQKRLPKGTAGPIALPVASDDAHARQKVMALVEELAVNAVDEGSRPDSWPPATGDALLRRGSARRQAARAFHADGITTHGSATRRVPGQLRQDGTWHGREGRKLTVRPRGWRRAAGNLPA